MAFSTSQFRTVGSDDAARFLSPVLKRVQTKVSQSSGVGMSEDSEDATLFTELVDLDFSQLSFPNSCLFGKPCLSYPKLTGLRYDALVRIYFAVAFYFR